MIITCTKVTVGNIIMLTYDKTQKNRQCQMNINVTTPHIYFILLQIPWRSWYNKTFKKQLSIYFKSLTTKTLLSSKEWISAKPHAWHSTNMMPQPPHVKLCTSWYYSCSIKPHITTKCHPVLSKMSLHCQNTSYTAFLKSYAHSNQAM